MLKLWKVVLLWRSISSIWQLEALGKILLFPLQSTLSTLSKSLSLISDITTSGQWAFWPCSSSHLVLMGSPVFLSWLSDLWLHNPPTVPPTHPCHFTASLLRMIQMFEHLLPAYSAPLPPAARGTLCISNQFNAPPMSMSTEAPLKRYNIGSWWKNERKRKKRKKTVTSLTVIKATGRSVWIKNIAFCQSCSEDDTWNYHQEVYDLRLQRFYSICLYWTRKSSCCPGNINWSTAYVINHSNENMNLVTK